MNIDNQYIPSIHILDCAMENGVKEPGFWNIDRMSRPYWRFYWMPKVNCRILLDGISYRPGPEDFVLIPPYTPFSGRSDEPLWQFIIHFQAKAPYDVLDPAILCFPVNEDIRKLIEETAELALQHEKINLRISLLCQTLCSRAMLEIPEKLLKVHVRDEKIEKAVKLLESDLGRRISSEELARLSGMNKSAFIRLFRKKTSQTPQEYHVRKRLESAVLLLEKSNRTIDEIASDRAFCNRNHFSSAFYKAYGFWPGEYRRKFAR